MAQAGSIGTDRLVEILTGTAGLGDAVAAVSAQAAVELGPIPIERVIAQNVAAELMERSNQARYPAVYVYCDRVRNALREKFRTFSGQARMAVEIRVSQDRLEGLERAVQLYVDAVTAVLDSHRGDWGRGMFYPGIYEVSYGPVRHGGRNYLQIAKVAFELEISV